MTAQEVAESRLSNGAIGDSNAQLNTGKLNLKNKFYKHDSYILIHPVFLI